MFICDFCCCCCRFCTFVADVCCCPSILQKLTARPAHRRGHKLNVASRELYAYIHTYTQTYMQHTYLLGRKSICGAYVPLMSPLMQMSACAHAHTHQHLSLQHDFFFYSLSTSAMNEMNEIDNATY